MAATSDRPTPGSPSPRRLTHWSVLVPLLTLAFCTAGFVAERAAVQPASPLDVTPAPQSELPPLVLPARTRTLAGQVLGRNHDPQSEALIWLIAQNEPHWTHTDATGAFRLEGLQRGPWTVYVVAHAHAPFVLTVLDDGREEVIVLPDDEHRAPAFEKRARAAFSGRIAGAAGEELEGCEIVLTPLDPPETLDAPLARRAHADAHGRFAIDDLFVGEYTLRVLPEWARGGSWPDLAQPLAAEPMHVRHSESAPGPLEIRLASGALRGKLADEHGHSLEGALVLVWPEGSPARVWPPAAAAPSGVFELHDLPAGRYVLSIHGGSAATEIPIEIRAGETLEVPVAPLPAARPR